MNQIRILVLFGGVAGYGSERATLNILKNLKQRGIRLHIITRADADPIVKRLVAGIGASNSVVVWGPLLGKNIFNPLELYSVMKGLAQTSSTVYREIKKFRPTHIYYGNILYYFYACLALINTKIPMVYRLGDVVPPARVYKFIFDRLIRTRVSHFVCISEFIRQYGIEKGISKDRLSVIYNHVPTDLNSLNGSVRLNKEAENLFVVSYVGRIDRAKGVHCFIDAAIELLNMRQNIIFYLAGDVEYKNPFAKKQTQRVKELGLEGRIVFLGFLEDPVELYRMTDILCVPSMCGEALGNVVLEAKSFDIPSVVFPDGGLPEMIEHGVDGFVCKDKTVAALKEGILFFMENKERLLGAKKAAHESLKRFDPDRIMTQWEKVFLDTK